MAQNKIKLVIYLLSFTFFVLINNLFTNIFSLVFFKTLHFYITCIHCKVPIHFYPILQILIFSLCKVLFFIWLHTLLKKTTKTSIYISEILISYFLFDFGFLISQIIDVFHLTDPKQLWNFCSSSQTLITPMIGWPFATIVSLFWCFALWRLLKIHRKFDWIFIAKRCFVMFFSLLTLNILRLFL